MTDDWTWDHDGSGHDMPDDHHDHDGGYEDPFGGGDDLPDGLGDHGVLGGDAFGHDDDPHGSYDDGSFDGGSFDGGSFDAHPFGGGDPFSPDALVSEHHDWSAGLDDDGVGSSLGDPVGADPDVDPYADGSWATPEFPALVDLGGAAPEPIDGPPWTDPSTLGMTPMSEAFPAEAFPAQAPEPADLAAYAGLDPTSPDAGWDALAASDDPATAALARFWGAQPS